MPQKKRFVKCDAQLLLKFTLHSPENPLLKPVPSAASAKFNLMSADTK